MRSLLQSQTIITNYDAVKILKGFNYSGCAVLTCALCLLLAGGVVGGPALGVDGHVLAHVAARRVLVRADRVLPQLAVLVAARVPVLGAEQPRVALLVPLHPQVAAE